jgi:hypothetical protein
LHLEYAEQQSSQRKQTQSATRALADHTAWKNAPQTAALASDRTAKDILCRGYSRKPAGVDKFSREVQVRPEVGGLELAEAVVNRNTVQHEASLSSVEYLGVV